MSQEKSSEIDQNNQPPPPPTQQQPLPQELKSNNHQTHTHSVRGDNHHHHEEIKVLRSHKSPARTFTSGVLFGDTKKSRDRSNSIGHSSTRHFSRSNSTHNSYDGHDVSIKDKISKNSVFGTLSRSSRKSPNNLVLLKVDPSETSPITHKLSKSNNQQHKFVLSDGSDRFSLTNDENTPKRDLPGETDENGVTNLAMSVDNLEERVYDNGFPDDNPEGIACVRELSAQTEREIIKQMADMGKLLINLSFPDKGISKVELLPTKTLKDLLQHQISLHQYELDSLVAKDGTGNLLDWNIKVGDLNLPTMDIKLVDKREEARPFYIYLPNSIRKAIPWEPNSTKDLKTILQTYVFEAKPEYQNIVPTSSSNPEEKYTDLNIKLYQIPDREICIGTDKDKWLEPKKIKTKKQKSNSQAISRVRTSLTKTKVSAESISGISLTRRLAFFYVYLPDGTIKTYSFEQYKEAELGELLEQLLKNRGNLTNIQELFDLEGRALDLKKKLKDLGVLEVTCIPLKSWIARAASENIQDYLKAETTSDTLALKVYLPQGRDSQFPWKDFTKFKLSQVLTKIKVKRADLNLSNAVAEDLLGNDLDINKTVEELDLKEICFGVNIVDWILYVEKEKNNNELIDQYDKKQIIEYFFNLDQKSATTTTRRDKNYPGGLKSPPASQKKELGKSTAQISISEQLQNLKLNDPIQMNSQLTSQVTSIWHIQHYYFEDEKHFDHYSEHEGQFKYTYMVPFPFLESAPNRKKPWERFQHGGGYDLKESNEEKNQNSKIQNNINNNEDIIPHLDNQQSSYEEFVNLMESKINERKRNDSFVSVVYER